MQLLVSVTCAEEAAEALRGGAHIIDAKDPRVGALGAVALDTFSAIRAVVGDGVVVSAALGDAGDSAATERLAAELAVRGAAFVKLGFAAMAEVREVGRILERAVRGCSRGCEASSVIAVAYADAARVDAVGLDAARGDAMDARALIRVAADAGARGVLVDTADKAGPGLTALWSATQLTEWVAEVHEYGMVASVAGKLRIDDLDVARAAGADIVGVRGAACIDGRLGRVSADHVRALRSRLVQSATYPPVVARSASGEGFPVRPIVA